MLHKAQLALDRMSCHSATANQVRLALHTAAFWLMHGMRAAIPQTSPFASAEFATIRERLIKIGARVIEHIARIRSQRVAPSSALPRWRPRRDGRRPSEGRRQLDSTDNYGPWFPECRMSCIQYPPAPSAISPAAIARNWACQ
jgi:hypothetical protein